LGGGAVVNKSPEKVDCSAAFGARYGAKNIVAAGLASKCAVQLAYAIGIARPFSIYVNTYGTGLVPDERLEAIISSEDVFDLTPAGMIEGFNLLDGDIYRRIPKTFFMDDYSGKRRTRWSTEKGRGQGLNPSEFPPEDPEKPKGALICQVFSSSAFRFLLQKITASTLDRVHPFLFFAFPGTILPSSSYL
jgi:hypothetical protein